MNKTFLFLLIVLLVIPNAEAAQVPEFPFIYAVGKATKEVPPNMVKLTFDLVAFDENPENSLEIVKKRSIELIQLFKKFDIPKTNIEAYEINKEAKRQEKEYVKLTILGYEVTQKFSIKASGLTKYPAFIESLLKMKNISNINAEFDVVERKSIETELIVKASEDAKVRAENMAAGAGANLGSVYAISDHEFYEVQSQFGMGSGFEAAMFKKSMMGGDEYITIIPSTIKIEKNVNMIFKLETK